MNHDERTHRLTLIAAAHLRACQRRNIKPPQTLFTFYPALKKKRVTSDRAKFYRDIMQAILDGQMTQREIARQFGLSESAVGKVKRGTLAGKHTTDLRAQLPQERTLTTDEVKAIYTAAWNGTPQTDIMARFGVTQPQVSDIKHRRTWKRVTAGMRGGET